MMQPRRIITLVVACVALGAIAAMAQKDKQPEIGNFPFWPGPKGGHTGQYVPGLNAALLLTPDQIDKLHAAWRETVGSEAVQSVGRAVKSNPNASEAEKQNARQTSERAHTELRSRVEAVLTADQKTLLERVGAAYGDTQKSVGADFQSQYAAAKGNEQEMQRVRKEAQARIQTEFERKLDGVLNAQQKAAMTAAAELEKKRAAEASAKKKPDK